MQRPKVCLAGLSITFLAACFRLAVRQLCGDFDPRSLTSFADVQAWADIIDIVIIAGLALSAIGWLVPPRER